MLMDLELSHVLEIAIRDTGGWPESIRDKRWDIPSAKRQTFCRNHCSPSLPWVLTSWLCDLAALPIKRLCLLLECVDWPWHWPGEKWPWVNPRTPGLLCVSPLTLDDMSNCLWTVRLAGWRLRRQGTKAISAQVPKPRFQAWEKASWLQLTTDTWESSVKTRKHFAHAHL